MVKNNIPVTPAIRVLRKEKINFTNHIYAYEEKGGTSSFAKKLGLKEHSVIKTLVMEDEKRKPLIVLMHGDLEVSTKNLARSIGVKSVAPCSPETATKHTGYLVGGTSPLGTRKQIPVYMEETVLDLIKIYINGGKRGLAVGLAPKDIVRILRPKLVQVGIKL